jgi:hypothetical protein
VLVSGVRDLISNIPGEIFADLEVVEVGSHNRAGQDVVVRSILSGCLLLTLFTDMHSGVLVRFQDSQIWGSK